ncbi:MAG: hypothetical protein Q7S11_05045 [bacterium]|nr:hypothetical protein [bacterium]
MKDLQGVDNKNQRITPTTENDRLVESTEDRVVICANIIKDDIEYGMVTTHGQWVRGGVTNDVQRQSTRSLIHFVLAQAGRRNGIVLVGDMNFGRNSEIYKMFIDKKFRDCVPLEIDNTLDPEHPAVRKGIRVVRDYFMICEGYGGDFVSYDLHEVSEVILRPGVSDHCALSATISMVPA